MIQTLFGFDNIKSISYSNDEIISNIMNLCKIDRFDLDCTYSKGVFWRNFNEPKHKTDLYPQADGVVCASSDNLPFEDSSIESIMFDPPFIIHGATKEKKDQSASGSCIIAKRFEGYLSFLELKNHYYGTIVESFRILKKDGYLVVKCQDTVSSGKNHFTHNMVMNMALSVGFYPKDLFILFTKGTITSGKWEKQHHARKFHSYFWVFQKSKCRVDYSF